MGQKKGWGGEGGGEKRERTGKIRRSKKKRGGAGKEKRKGERK